jgi:hypothetical protein
MELSYILNINNIKYDVSIAIYNDRTIFTDWEPAFNDGYAHDFAIRNNKIQWWTHNEDKFPPEFKDYCDNLVKKFIKLKAFI